ncbi:hypothetical protein EJ08DRAFT_699449 [Tothia fuscella]|uniref:Uncharacterized protein n=1 Tax=Tothia fuscella TaxID=1048955 RepID=A0A9P4NMK0_9PEZI|nr:hypothetical protein EJ08DRAFT_699449 [Tothia fuscella]
MRFFAMIVGFALAAVLTAVNAHAVNEVKGLVVRDCAATVTMWLHDGICSTLPGSIGTAPPPGVPTGTSPAPQVPGPSETSAAPGIPVPPPAQGTSAVTPPAGPPANTQTGPVPAPPVNTESSPVPASPSGTSAGPDSSVTATKTSDLVTGTTISPSKTSGASTSAPPVSAAAVDNSINAAGMGAFIMAAHVLFAVAA